jgi:hypothetical protein
MAAANNAEQKKRASHHVDGNHRDGGTGMSAWTKIHFDHVKRKMFAFMDQRYRREVGGIQLLPPIPPPPFRPNSPLIFFDQNKTPKQRLHPHPTPVPPHRQLPHLQVPVPPHRQLPHLGLATPQVARRIGRPRLGSGERLSPNVVFF